jgi:energy-coupling factor transporter ATP-binding protein EcfA2
MITRVDIRNFRMLRANSVSLPSFVVLVGKNATGKSTLIAALRFVSDLIKGGVELALANALEREAPSFLELCFDASEPVEIGLEMSLSADPVRGLGAKRARYEVRVGPDVDGSVIVQREHLFLLPEQDPPLQLSLWGNDVQVIHEHYPREWRKVVGKTEPGKDYFQDEFTAWNNVFKFGADRAALGGIPEDENRFPQTLRIRDFLRDGVTHLDLDSAALRNPSVPRAPSRLLPNGSNLARAAQVVRVQDAVAYRQWVSHVSGAVEGLKDIDVWERPEDKKLVLRASFEGVHGGPVPSWLLSDGTLRLLALSLLSYAPGTPGVALIEEPENGLHPLAMQAVYDALSQPPLGGQVLVATHSPVFLAHVALEQALVFRREPDGSALVRRGVEVPELKNWKSTATLADVFATGVLA